MGEAFPLWWSPASSERNSLISHWFQHRRKRNFFSHLCSLSIFSLLHSWLIFLSTLISKYSMIYSVHPVCADWVSPSLPCWSGMQLMSLTWKKKWVGETEIEIERVRDRRYHVADSPAVIYTNQNPGSPLAKICVSSLTVLTGLQVVVITFFKHKGTCRCSLTDHLSPLLQFYLNIKLIWWYTDL